MTMYQLFCRHEKSENTPECGFGDCPVVTWRPAGSMFAASERDAQRKFKALFKHLRFGGRFPNAFAEPK